MKRKRTILGLIMFLVGAGLMIYAAISAVVFNFQHVDMTELRQFIENPAPTILVIVGYIVAYTGISMTRYK